MVINWTTAITIIGSLGVASTAQVISHLFSQKRDTEKYNKECLQNLYSPIIFPIVEYINGEAYRNSATEAEWFDETEFEKDPLNPDRSFKKTMEHISKNMKYAHTDLIIKYEELKFLTELYNKEREDRSILLRHSMDLYGECLIEFIKISEQLGTLSNRIKQKLNPALFFTQFYLLLIECEIFSLIDDSPHIVNYLEDILNTEGNFLNRILDIRKKINYTNKNSNNEDKDKIEQTFQNAYDLFHEIINELHKKDPERAHIWKDNLENNWGLRNEMLG
ncbi:hypothetical protein [Priestia megaterium]|uniref:hypothetical protein n=1 Tax=Priestia megaterium TaxID=1404 RepID=UPI0034D5908E